MGTSPLALAIDDEPGILRLLELELSEHEFRVVTTTDPAAALRLAEQHKPDVILLDVLMPQVNGIDLLSTLHDATGIPVIFVSANDRELDKVRALELGGDDYVVKPFSADELSARIRAVLRRHANSESGAGSVHADGLDIDFDSRTVRRGQQNLLLTRTEWMLLQHLASRPGKVILNPELLSSVWGPEYRHDLQYLRVWISRLRKKIERDPANPAIIQTVPGVGYKFLAAEPAGVSA